MVEISTMPFTMKTEWISSLSLVIMTNGLLFIITIICLFLILSLMEVLENTPTLSPSWKYVQQSLELTEKLESNPEEVLGVAKLSKAITIPAFQTKGVLKTMT